MSTIPAPKIKIAKSNLTTEQRAWLKKLGAVVNSAGNGAADTETAAPPARGTQPGGSGGQRVAAIGAPAGSKEGIAPAAVLPIIIPIIIAKAKITCKCQIV